jgi:hypothetical protein
MKSIVENNKLLYKSSENEKNINIIAISYLHI